MARLNVRHFNKIIKHIKADLRRLWMPTYGVRKGTVVAEHEKLTQFAECNTAACFAGWSRLLSIPQERWKDQFTKDGAFRMLIAGSETYRLGLSGFESSQLFASKKGSRKQQWETVRKRLKKLIAARVAQGETSAKRIKI